MSLIVKQSFSNIIIILLAFTLGALNTLWNNINPFSSIKYSSTCFFFWSSAQCY